MQTVIASWFGSGLLLRRLRGSDSGSGTVGAAVAFVLAMAIRPLGWGVQAGVFVVVTILSVWSSNGLADPDSTKEHDPGWVVIDEAAGTLLATIGLGLSGAIAAFVAFRLADIFKKAFPGVARAENLPGGWGITADDLVAGIYGLAAGWIVTGLIS